MFATVASNEPLECHMFAIPPRKFNSLDEQQVFLDKLPLAVSTPPPPVVTGMSFASKTNKNVVELSNLAWTFEVASSKHEHLTCAIEPLTHEK